MSEVKIKGVFDKDFVKTSFAPVGHESIAIDGRREDILATAQHWANFLGVTNGKGVETMSVDGDGKLNTKTLTAGTIDVKIDIELYDKPRIEIVDGEIVARFGKVNVGGQK